MSILSKFKGGSFKYRLPSYLESLRIKGSVTRRCRKYMNGIGEDEKIESEEWMAEFIESIEHLFEDIKGVKTYIDLFDNEKSEKEAFEAVNSLIDHIYMSSKKKARSKT